MPAAMSASPGSCARPGCARTARRAPGCSGRDTIEIDHPAGEEIQWDWFERRRAPWGGTAYVLLGTLPHSSRVRGVLAESMDQPHLIEAIDAVMRRHGGTAAGLAHRPAGHGDRARHAVTCSRRSRRWPSITARSWSRARRGAVTARARSSRAVRYRVWPVVAHDDRDHAEDAQRSLDAFCAGPGDARTRRSVAGPVTVAALAEAEPLLALPAAPFPATVSVSRVVGDNAAVAFRGNAYSVPPGLGGTVLTLSHRLGSGTVEVASPAGGLLVSHRLAPAGAGALVRTAAHRAELERVVLSAFTTARPCERKANRPPGEPRPRRGGQTAGRAGCRRRDRPGPLRRTRRHHHRRRDAPSTAGGAVSESSTYQQLRGHLAALKLTAAAEALPARTRPCR